MAEDQERENLMRQVSEKRERENLIAQVKAKRESERVPTDSEKGSAALAGFGDSATFGYLPELQAATYPAVEAVGEYFTGQDIEDETYDERLGAARKETAETKEKAPYYAMGGELAGYAVPGMGITKGLKGVRSLAAAKKMHGVNKLAKGALGVGGLGQKMKGLATVGAIEGAAYNPARYDVESEQEVEGSRIQGALMGATLGGSIPVATKALGASWKAIGKATGGLYHGAGKLGKKVLSVMGVEEHVIKDYLDNPDLINKATDFEAVKNRIDDVIRPIKKELSEAEIDYKTAKERLKNAEDVITSNFREKDKEIKSAFKSAKSELDHEFRSSYDQLNKIKPPLHLQDGVETSLNRLKTQVIKGSGEALDLLQKDLKGQEVDITGAAALLDDSLERLLVKGEIPKAGPGRIIATQISDLQDDLARFGGKLSPYDAKRYIRNLDEYIDWGEKEFGSFSRPDIIAAKNVRGYLDKTLKDASPGYQQMMEAVADDARALSNARQEFGNVKKIASSLNNIDKDVNNHKRMILRELGERTGIDFSSDVSEYLAVKSQMKALKTVDGKAEAIRDLHSWKDFDEAKKSLDDFAERSDLEKKVAQKRELEKTAAYDEAEVARQRVVYAKEAEAQVKTFRESTTESKLGQFMTKINSGKRGEGMTLRQEFEKLSQLADEDFVELVGSLRMQEQFDRSFLRGSRNVNLFSVVGMATQSMSSRTGLSGGVVGSLLGGPAGLMIGASFGAMVDHYGPAMTKKMLDAVLSMKGIPSFKKIQKFDLPPKVKQELITMFEQYALVGLTGEAVEVAPEDIPAIREDIARNSDLKALDRAKINSHLNKNGELIMVDKMIGKPESIEDILKKKANFQF